VCSKFPFFLSNPSSHPSSYNDCLQLQLCLRQFLVLVLVNVVTLLATILSWFKRVFHPRDTNLLHPKSQSSYHTASVIASVIHTILDIFENILHEAVHHASLRERHTHKSSAISYTHTHTHVVVCLFSYLIDHIRSIHFS
jgi:hypothetical protein